jgi:diketogulonate reductase-like aldo/keto reductase
MRFDHPSIQKVAKAQGKSQAQIFLRWGLQHVSHFQWRLFRSVADMQGFIVIPKSVSEARIISNSEVFDFELSPSEMEEVSLFPCVIAIELLSIN